MNDIDWTNWENDLKKSVEDREEFFKGGKRTGIYQDNATNRQLKRVGQKYSKDKIEEQSKEKKPKQEEQSKETGKKQPEESKENKPDNIEEFAKKASAEQLQKYLDDPKNQGTDEYDVAKKELNQRNKEGKSADEVKLDKIKEDLEYYKKEVAQAEQDMESMKSPALQAAMAQGVDEGYREINKLAKEHDALKKKIEEDKKPKWQKDSTKFSKMASVDDLSKRVAELAKESQQAMDEGKERKAKQLIEESEKYTKEIKSRLGESGKPLSKIAKMKQKLSKVPKATKKDFVNGAKISYKPSYLMNTQFEHVTFEKLINDDIAEIKNDKGEKVLAPVDTLYSGWVGDKET
jgi:hypothetical protein